MNSTKYILEKLAAIIAIIISLTMMPMMFVNVAMAGGIFDSESGIFFFSLLLHSIITALVAGFLIPNPKLTDGKESKFRTSISIVFIVLTLLPILIFVDPSFTMGMSIYLVFLVPSIMEIVAVIMKFLPQKSKE